MRLSVPDFEALLEHYREHHNIAILESNFIGGQKDQYDFHYYQFDFQHLHELLEAAGFSNVERYNWQAFLPEGFDDYSRAYLPHMDFENGKLMVLNVTAVKIGEPNGRIKDLTLGVTHKQNHE